MTVFELLKYLPKTNCGDCGEPTCMAFATKVVTTGLDVTKCPHLKEVPTELIDKEGSGVTQGTPDPETQLLKELKAKIKGVDLEGLAQDLGAEVVSLNDLPAIKFPFIDDVVILSNHQLLSQKGEDLDPRDQILIYNYCFFGGKGPMSGEWVGLESFPNSVSKVSTLKRYTEDKLAEEFSGSLERLRERVKRIGGQLITPCNADLCFEITVLPKIILRFHFWESEPEEGFAAQAKVLYDRRAIEFLDLESLVFAAERAVEKLIRKGP